MIRKVRNILLLAVFLASCFWGGGGTASAVEIHYVFADGVVDQYYEEYVEVLSGTGSYQWSYSGSLPAGLEFQQYDDQYWLEGTPLESGNFEFVVYLTDLGDNTTTSEDFSITIHTEDEVFLYWDYYLDGDIDVFYYDYLWVDGGTPPYSWNTSGDVPGLDFLEEDDALVLSGTPTASGIFPIDYTVTDSAGYSVSGSTYVAIFPNMDVYYVYPSGTVRESYENFIEVRGGNSPYTWEHSGDIPGLTFSGNDTATTGNRLILKGIPTVSGTYPVDIQVTDKDGFYILFSLEITIEPATTPTPVDSVSEDLVIEWTFTNGTVGVPYYDLIKAKGGSGEGYEWAKDGALPDGLDNKITGEQGEFVTLYNESGPTKPGDYKFTLYLNDNAGNSISQDFIITVFEAMRIDDVFNNGKIGDLYESKVKVTGGNGNYTWNYDEDANIPDGLKLSDSEDTVTLSGTPRKAGNSQFTLKVSVNQPYYGEEGVSNVTTTLTKNFKVIIVGADVEEEEMPEVVIVEEGTKIGNNTGSYITGGYEGDDSEYYTDKVTSVVENIEYLGADTMETKMLTEESDKQQSEATDKSGGNGSVIVNVPKDEEGAKTLPGKIADALAGGGCNAGFGGLGLMFLGAVLISKRSR